MLVRLSMHHIRKNLPLRFAEGNHCGVSSNSQQYVREDIQFETWMEATGDV